MDKNRFQLVKGKDVIDVEILADGTVKSTTARVSGANHQSAEGFLTSLGQLLGGLVTRKRRGDHAHSHAHGDHHHDHAH